VITVGSRFLEKDSLPGWSLIRKSLTIFGHALTKYLLGITQDATGAFRVYQLRSIDRAMFGLIASRGYSFFFESLFFAHQNGLSIKDVPIVLPARTYGESKMQMVDIRASVQQLFTLSITSKVHPERFKVGQDSVRADESVEDPQGWDRYWERKHSPTGIAYETLANVYRTVAIKSRLDSTIRREFPRGSQLLHAGCGSGRVDVDLHDYADITAVDVSVPALRTYQRENPRAHAIRHASILNLPFANESFDGAYSLGLLEHFDREHLVRALEEVRRVLRPHGKFVIFWPHASGTSVKVLNGVHWMLNDLLRKDVHLHPPEISLVHSQEQAKDLLESGGFELKSFDFGPKDLFVQAVVVAARS
jgi:SAM-dependent methyltransferase